MMNTATAAAPRTGGIFAALELMQKAMGFLDDIEERWYGHRRRENAIRDAELLLRDVIDGQAPAFERKGVILTRELLCERAFLAENGAPLGAALSQVLAYALKCALPGCTVSVRARCEGPAVRIEVIDGRTGLSVQQLTAAFAKEASASHGLGLARRVIGELGGRMGLEQAGWSAGYLLWVTLPYLWKEIK